jgi:hypothetical protein
MLAIVNQPANAKKTITTRDPKGEKEQSFSQNGYAVKQLLGKGANRNLKNAAGRTAMELATEKGDAEILSLLMAKP